MHRFGVSVLLVCCATITAVSCERVLIPQRTALSELRGQSTAGAGPFIGRVREVDATTGNCHRGTRAVAGARVEVGLWDGSPAYYRDTLTRRPPSAPNDARFQFLAFTIADAEGRFRFDNMPKRVGYAMRVIPPKGSPWRVSYGESMYGVSNAELEEFPTLCVQPR